MFKRIILAALALAGCLSTTALAGTLGVGDAAPPLAVKTWVKGEPVKGFEKGQTYVVEFWATWCGPCIRSIPHVSELQQTYKAKNVIVVGVSVWEREDGLVEPFVEKMGDKMAYRVGKDDGTAEKGGHDGTMAKTWMAAAGQDGIPAAFVVNGEGKIAWIGHPMNMDKPLAEIVAGTWDMKAAIEKQAAERRVKEQKEKLNAALGAKDNDAALALIEQMIAADPKEEEQLGPLKFTVLLWKKSYDDAYAYGGKLVDGALKDSPQGLNMIAWTIVDPDAKDLEKRDLRLALRAATRANEVAGNKSPEVLDTLAKVHFDSGDVARAIEAQTRAVELAKGSPMEAELKRRLEQYKKTTAKGA